MPAFLLSLNLSEFNYILRLLSGTRSAETDSNQVNILNTRPLKYNYFVGRQDASM